MRNAPKFLSIISNTLVHNPPEIESLCVTISMEWIETQLQPTIYLNLYSKEF